MNKYIKQHFGIAAIALAVLIFFLTIWFLVKTPYEDYTSQVNKAKKDQKALAELEDQAKKIKAQEEQEQSQLKSLRPVYETTSDSPSNSTGLYGTMFDEIIKLAQNNGLLIRSIEYDVNPHYDPIFASYGDFYNVCEFKFFFVGSYNQLKAFLTDINNQFKWFISIAKMDVTAFEGNSDYLLIKISFTLYSKKAIKNNNNNNNSTVFAGSSKKQK